MVHDHLHFHLVSPVHPLVKCFLLHPVIHFAEQYFRVTRCSHILLVESLNSFEALAHKSDVQGVPNILAASLITFRELLTSHASFVEIKGLPEISLPHLE